MRERERERAQDIESNSFFLFFSGKSPAYVPNSDEDSGKVLDFRVSLMYLLHRKSVPYSCTIHRKV